jgi:hypothetical protein
MAGTRTVYQSSHYPSDYLTHATFKQVLANAKTAESNDTTAAEALQQ